MGCGSSSKPRAVAPEEPVAATGEARKPEPQARKPEPQAAAPQGGEPPAEAAPAASPKGEEAEADAAKGDGDAPAAAGAPDGVEPKSSLRSAASIDALLEDLGANLEAAEDKSPSPSTNAPSASSPVLPEALASGGRPSSRQGGSRPGSRLSRGRPSSRAGLLVPGAAGGDGLRPASPYGVTSERDGDLVDMFDEKEDFNDRAMAFQIEEMMGVVEANLLDSVEAEGGGVLVEAAEPKKQSLDLTITGEDYEKLMEEILEDASPK